MAVTLKKGPYEDFIASNIVVEKDCICFILRRNPRKNFYVIGDGTHTFIELAKPGLFMLLYAKIKLYLNKNKKG